MWKQGLKLSLLSLPLLLCACAPAVKREYTEESLRVYCPDVLRTKGYYCDGDRAYSNKVQSGSRVKITSLSTNRHITIAVFRREDIDGICVPEKFKSLLGSEPFPARLEVQRCGVDDRKTCPAYLKGLASYYGEPYHRRQTPYGTVFDQEGLYAASRDLPLGTLLEVRNLKNRKSVVVKVIDRGPFKEGRVLDLSYEAAKRLDMIKDGVVEVEARVLRCGD